MPVRMFPDLLQPPLKLQNGFFEIERLQSHNGLGEVKQLKGLQGYNGNRGDASEGPHSDKVNALLRCNGFDDLTILIGNRDLGPAAYQAAEFFHVGRGQTQSYRRRRLIDVRMG